MSIGYYAKKKEIFSVHSLWIPEHWLNQFEQDLLRNPNTDLLGLNSGLILDIFVVWRPFCSIRHEETLNTVVLRLRRNHVCGQQLYCALWVSCTGACRPCIHVYLHSNYCLIDIFILLQHLFVLYPHVFHISIDLITSVATHAYVQQVRVDCTINTARPVYTTISAFHSHAYLIRSILDEHAHRTYNVSRMQVFHFIFTHVGIRYTVYGLSYAIPYTQSRSHKYTDTIYWHR